MGKTSIVIGEKEKHTLEIGWSYWLGDVTIKIDGLLKKDLPFQDPCFWTTFQRSYDFAVGSNEPHSIHIETDGNFKPPIKALILDGKIIQLPVDGPRVMPEASASTRFEVHPRLNTFQGALKFGLTGSTEQEPSSFWQRHFEGKQVVEQMSYSDFLEKIRTTMSQLGFKKIIDIKLDHREAFDKSVADSNLDAGISSVLTDLLGTGRNVSDEVEINLAKQTEFLQEHLRVSYSARHDINKQALCIYARFAPIDSTQDKKESLAEYQNNLNSKYGASIKNDFMTIYRKIAGTFPLLDENQVLHLEDPRGQEISLAYS